jgi:predicted dehydrogenase
VIGLGAFGEDYLTCLRGLGSDPDVEVVAVCSSSAARAQTIATRFGVPRWYTDVDAFAADPEIDVACVVTVEQAHCRPALACIAAGKHVIVEKPLATRLDEADAMIAAAGQAGRFLMVGHLLRFELHYRSLAAQVAADEIGEIASLHTRRNRPAALVARYRRTHPLLETGILDLDVMLWLTGSWVERVRSFARTINPGPTPDLVWAVLEFASGAIGVLETSWLAPDQGGIFTDDALSVVGSRGSARLDLNRAPLALWTESGYNVPDVAYGPSLDGGIAGALAEELTYFVRCVRTGQSPDRVPLTDVRHGLEVALELIRSSEDGQDRTVASP